MLHKHPKENMCLKQDSGINRGSRVYTGIKYSRNPVLQNLEHLGYDVDAVTENPEARKMLNAVQKAAVGTEIRVEAGNYSNSDYDYGTAIYRVTGTVREKKIVPINEEAREAIRVEGLPTEIPISNRRAISTLLDPMWENGSVKLSRGPLTDKENAEARRLARWERQVRAGERRQMKFSFYEEEMASRQGRRRKKING